MPHDDGKPSNAKNKPCENRRYTYYPGDCLMLTNTLPAHHQLMAPAAPPQTIFGLSYTQLEAFATATIAVLTFVYIIVAFCQWLAMRAALRQTRISNDRRAAAAHLGRTVWRAHWTETPVPP